MDSGKVTFCCSLDIVRDRQYCGIAMWMAPCLGCAFGWSLSSSLVFGFCLYWYFEWRICLYTDDELATFVSIKNKRQNKQYAQLLNGSTAYCSYALIQWQR